MRPLKDLAIGETGTLVEKIDHEVRWTVYQRRVGEARYPNNVCVYRIACMQGVLGEEPRFSRVGGSLYPSEAHGMTPLEAAQDWPVREVEPTPGDGFVLAPVEPTKRMLKAACKAMSPKYRPTSEFVSVNEKHRIRYVAMINARPNGEAA
jgi:hypothetical protein